MKSYLQLLYNGIIKENPSLILMLGMCPTLAVTTSASNGMGMKVTEAEFKDQFLGDDVDSFVVNKAGGSTEPNQIDSVAGATISSRAVTNAVNAARDFFAANMK